MNYNEVSSNFMHFMKVNGFDTHQDRDTYLFGGSANKSFRPVCINLPRFNYDDLKKTDFFENQKNYDLSISQTRDENGNEINQVTVLLKDLYTDTFCESSEFINILTKIKNLKSRFLVN